MVYINRKMGATTELVRRFNENTKEIIPASEYIAALREIFENDSVSFCDWSKEQAEEVIIRSYNDHSESRFHLSHLIRNKSNISKALDIFEVTTISGTVDILVECLLPKSSTPSAIDMEYLYIWLKELHIRIHYGEDTNLKYLETFILQLLNKDEQNILSFESWRFLIKDLGLRIKEPQIIPLALLIFSELDKKYHDKFVAKFSDFIDTLIMETEAEIGNDPLAIIVDMLTEFYPVMPTLCSSIFLGRQLDELFKEKVVEQEDTNFSISLLKLLSVGCIDEMVRNHIAENYSSMLEKSLSYDTYKPYSALVLTKTWSFTKLTNINITHLADILIETFINASSIENNNTDLISVAIEGLAYLSLKPNIKIKLRDNKTLIENLLTLCKHNLETSKHSYLYGSLIILANLSVSPDDSNKASNNSNEDRYSQRKAFGNYLDMANNKTKNSLNDDDSDNVKENKEDVLKFNKEYIVKSELISSLRGLFAKFSQNTRQQMIRIIYNLTRDKNVVVECIKQGAMTDILEFLNYEKQIQIKRNTNNSEEFDFIRLLASRALTKMLILTNPTLVFKKYSPINAIPFLIDLLPPSKIINAEDEETATTTAQFENSILSDDVITLQDNFESLLALTNLASCDNKDGDDVCVQIVNNEKNWSVIQNLMLDHNMLLQRSTLELLCNLMSHPLPIASKFFNFQNKDSERNFNLLVKLIELEDVQSQRAVCAIFANIASSIPFIAEELLVKKELIQKASRVLLQQNDDIEIRRRLLIFFYSLFEIIEQKPKSIGQENLMNNSNLKQALELSKSKPDTGSEYSDVIPAMLSKLKL